MFLLLKYMQGGMHIGYEEEGFTTVRAVEYDKQAVETFEHNNPGVPVYCGDIRKFIEKIETDKGSREALGRIDVIHTSSPCQGFSVSTSLTPMTREISVPNMKI